MRRIGTAVAAGLLMWAVALAPGMANAAVSTTPAATPQLGTSGTDGTIEQIRQIVQCGNTMYAVGTFTAVKNPNSSTLITRNNAFAFSATSPYRVTAWDPNLTNSAKSPTVNTVACAPDGGILLGGQFDTAKGAALTSKNLVKVDATTGAVNPAFLWTFNGTSSPSGAINNIEIVQNHLLVGGNFTAVAPRPSYLASVVPTTGRLDNYAMPAISGNYVYTGVQSNTTKIFNMIPNPTGTAVLMTGVFTAVGGQHHEQIFKLDIGTTATVDGWSPSELYAHCSTVEPFYAQDAAWSPDGTKIYVANTGYKLFDDAKPAKHPRTGPCDSAIAYDATPTTEFTGHLWQNYTGCDSLYSIGADATTVYVAGHERFIDNPNTCDALGTGGRAQPGLGEIDPATGISVPGPSRGRGLGADDVLVTPSGLWIASDNQANTDTCNNVHAHMGLCYLPYA